MTMDISKQTVTVATLMTLLVGAMGFTWSFSSEVSKLSSSVENVSKDSMERTRAMKETNQSLKENKKELQQVRIAVERMDAREEGATKLLQREIDHLKGGLEDALKRITALEK